MTRAQNHDLGRVRILVDPFLCDLISDLLLRSFPQLFYDVLSVLGKASLCESVRRSSSRSPTSINPLSTKNAANRSHACCACWDVKLPDELGSFLEALFGITVGPSMRFLLTNHLSGLEGRLCGQICSRGHTHDPKRREELRRV